MIDFDSVLAEARALATSATSATTRTKTGLQPYSGPASTVLPPATNQGKQNANAQQVASVASGSKREIDPEPAPINESSKVEEVAGLTPNKYCDERIFKLYGNQMASEQGLDRVYEVHQKALIIGINDEQAWDFAEAVAVVEFSGDNRRACLECSRYRHKQGSEYGVCTAAGKPPLHHMERGAMVNWNWLNRCKMHTETIPRKLIT